MVRLLLVSLLSLQGALALSPFTLKSRKQSSAVSYVNPNDGGGSVIDTSSSGLTEPLNVIISGQSSVEILTNDGFTKFAKAIDFNTFTGSDIPQKANLGDGNGLVNQALELRKIETGRDVTGNDYVRLFRQNGPSADTGALFLAARYLEDGAIEVASDGYDVGRDKFVKAATSYQGLDYAISADDITGLIPPGTPVGMNQDSKTDGTVVLLTITAVV